MKPIRYRCLQALAISGLLFGMLNDAASTVASNNLLAPATTARTGDQPKQKSENSDKNSRLTRTGDKIDPATAKKDAASNSLWYDIRLLGVEGQGFRDTKDPFDRLPARAEKLVRPSVWGLSKDSAGIHVRFFTDANSITARWTLTKKNLAMPHMPATGVSGLDLYVKSPDGQWRWIANGRPTATSNQQVLMSGPPKGQHEYLLYLPLYNGVTSVEIGLPSATSLFKAGEWTGPTRKPIVFYGTSITQGGCASRPGMVHTSIIGRRMQVPVINLGFSGNGRMEKEVGEFIAEIDASIYVIDCCPNLSFQQTAERTEPLVRQLRAKRPNVPILLVEDRFYSNTHFSETQRKYNEANHRELRAAFKRLTDAGVAKLYYLEGSKLLDDDREGTVDSSHPTDLGFMQHADAFIPVLKKILSENSKTK